jgi:hypothetical protein
MSRRRLAFFAAFDVGVVIIGNAMTEPHFAFTSFDANQVAIGIALVMPLVMALVGPPIARHRRRVVATLALWIAGLACLPAALFFLAEPCVNLSFSQTSTTFVSTGRYTVAVYQFEGFSGEEWGDVDQVCRIAPGFVFSRRLYERGGEVQVDAGALTVRPLVWPFC